MRDPKRIYPLCMKLAEYWSKVPDWRLTQLISNVIGDSPFNFYLEDDEVERAFDSYFNGVEIECDGKEKATD